MKTRTASIQPFPWSESCRKRRDSALAFLRVAALMAGAGATLDKQVSSGRMRVHFAHTARYSGHLEQLVEEQL